MKANKKKSLVSPKSTNMAIQQTVTVIFILCEERSIPETPPIQPPLPDDCLLKVK
jgi:hypothetical protein